MSCDCPTAPLLSGPGFENLTKPAAESVLQLVDWCPSVPTGGTIQGDAWVVTPITDPPLVAGAQGPQGLKTSAVISGGSPGQLYRVIGSVGAQGPQGPVQQVTFTLWVYIPADNTPAVFVPCEGA